MDHAKFHCARLTSHVEYNINGVITKPIIMTAQQKSNDCHDYSQLRLAHT